MFRGNWSSRSLNKPSTTTGPAKNSHSYGQERLCESPLNKVTENGSGSKRVLKNKLIFGRTKAGLKMANCTEEIVDIFASPRNHSVSGLKPDLSCNPNTTRRAHHPQQLNQPHPKPQVNQSKTPLLIYPSKQSR